MHVSHRYVQNLSTHSCVLRNHCMEHITESLVVCIGVYKIQHFCFFFVSNILVIINALRA